MTQNLAFLNLSADIQFFTCNCHPTRAIGSELLCIKEWLTGCGLVLFFQKRKRRKVKKQKNKLALMTSNPWPPLKQEHNIPLFHELGAIQRWNFQTKQIKLQVSGVKCWNEMSCGCTNPPFSPLYAHVRDERMYKHGPSGRTAPKHNTVAPLPVLMIMKCYLITAEDYY